MYGTVSGAAAATNRHKTHRGISVDERVDSIFWSFSAVVIKRNMASLDQQNPPNTAEAHADETRTHAAR
jgi:hypothetical protein